VIRVDGRCCQFAGGRVGITMTLASEVRHRNLQALIQLRRVRAAIRGIIGHGRSLDVEAGEVRDEDDRRTVGTPPDVRRIAAVAIARRERDDPVTDRASPREAHVALQLDEERFGIERSDRVGGREATGACIDGVREHLPRCEHANIFVAACRDLPRDRSVITEHHTRERDPFVAVRSRDQAFDAMATRRKGLRE
jgi:hypothetical protein